MNLKYIFQLLKKIGAKLNQEQVRLNWINETYMRNNLKSRQFFLPRITLGAWHVATQLFCKKN